MSEYGVKYGALSERMDKVAAMVYQKTMSAECQLDKLLEKHPELAKDAEFMGAQYSIKSLKWYVEEMS